VSYVRSFTGFRPAVRYDGQPWTHVRFEEAATPAGTRLALDTQILPVPDLDPTHPATRNLTTAAATLPAGFYWLVWIDDGGHEDPDGPVFSGTLPGVPTAADVRRVAPPNLDWTSLGYPAPASGDPDPLEARVSWAAAEVAAITGRDLTTLTADEQLIAQRAITLKVLLDTLGGTKDALDVLGQPWLRSFSAGSYSETRFSAAEMSGTQGRGSEKIVSLGPEPLATLLWLLMSPEKQDEWRFLLTGVAAPASRFIAQDWGGHEWWGPRIFGPGIETW
jgi:hypothetical protein